MKKYLFLFLSAFACIAVHSQVKEIKLKKQRFDSHWEEEQIEAGTTAMSYFPRDFVKDVRVFSGQDSVSGRTIGFMFFWDQRFFSRLDSVLIEFENKSKVVIGTLIKDSIQMDQRGYVWLKSTFLLDSARFIQLEENKVRKMEFFFEKRNVAVRIKRKSASKIIEIL